jgi:hypothetical protein
MTPFPKLRADGSKDASIELCGRPWAESHPTKTGQGAEYLLKGHGTADMYRRIITGQESNSETPNSIWCQMILKEAIDLKGSIETVRMIKVLGGGVHGSARE